MQCFDDFVAGSYETQSVPDVAEYSHLREDIRIDDAARRRLRQNEAALMMSKESQPKRRRAEFMLLSSVPSTRINDPCNRRGGREQHPTSQQKRV